jgi:penicillin-binding protein 2
MNDKVLDLGIRKRIFLGLIFIIVSLFAFRLVQMQIIDNTDYNSKSEENSVKTIEIDAPRGVIYDRNFEVLVSNKPSYNLYITPSEFEEYHTFEVEKKLELSEGTISSILQEHKGFSSVVPQKIFNNLPFSSIAWISENINKFPGLELQVDLQRDYSFGVYGSHMFGFIREINPKTLSQNKDIYTLGDFIGSSGLEKYYENFLRGQKGYNYIMTDAKRRVIGKFEAGVRDKLPVKGNDLILTIDKDVQKVAEDYFKERTGALVAIQPVTGEILAFVSAPYFDLDELSASPGFSKWTELSQSAEKPLFNRATMTNNPPGSTFKMITAIAGLEEGIIDKNFSVNCRGGYKYGDRTFKCTHVHGKVNVVQAIEKSCNTFFYQLILKIGLEKWSQYGKKFGFGKKTGIDFNPEIKGIIPDADYFDKAYGKGKWTSGYLISLAIGQGDIISSPMQLAKYMALLATGGKSKTPHFLKGIIDKSNEFQSFEYDDVKVDISESTIALIKEGLYKAVNGEGTATNIKDNLLQICGKTGTAQNPHGEDHALFVAYAPKDDPQIAVSVIVENVGYGSTHAAPAAKKVIETYLKKNGLYKSQIAQINK